MSFSYDPKQTTDLHKVRSRIGDTKEAKHYLHDEEISAILTDYPGVIAASCECIRRILALIARENDRQIGGVSSSRSQVTQHYQDLLEKLEGQVGSVSTGVLTGSSDQEIADLEEDTDLRPAQFQVGMDDHEAPLSEERES